MKNLKTEHIQVEQRSPEWFAARAGVLSGSVAGNIIAKGRGGEEAAIRKNLRMQKVAEILSGTPQELEFTNAAMQWGIEQEPNAVTAFEARTGILVQSMGFLVDKQARMGCSLDGLTDDSAILEIKCPNTVTHIEYLEKGEMPSKYKPQVQWNMGVANTEFGYFVSFDPRLPSNLQLLVVKVARDDQYISMLQEEAEKFNGEVDAIVNRLRSL